LQRLADDIQELGVVESSPKQDGRNMIMVIGPHRRKVEAKAEARAEAAEAKAEAAEAKAEAAEAKEAKAEARAANASAPSRPVPSPRSEASTEVAAAETTVETPAPAPTDA
jgi:translation initiation factor IF-3